MLTVTQTLIQELGLVARSLGLLSATVESERARAALLFSVETLGHVEQRIVDLDFMIRSRTIELEAARGELASLREGAPLPPEPLDVVSQEVVHPR
jgi:hypothetical protein